MLTFCSLCLIPNKMGKGVVGLSPVLYSFDTVHGGPDVYLGSIYSEKAEMLFKMWFQEDRMDEGEKNWSFNESD